MKTVLSLCMLLSLAAGSAGAGPNADLALQWLSDHLKDNQTRLPVLAALQASQESDVAPIFVALGQNADKDLRRLAPSALRKIGGESGAARLLKPMAGDASSEIRAEVLVHLSGLDAAEEPMLLEALKVADENLQCLAARSLVKIGRSAAALDTLRKLTESNDAATSAMARMALLATGSLAQIEPLKKLVAAPETPPQVLALLMEEAIDLKSSGAVELFEPLLQPESKAPMAVRLQAWRLVSELAADGATRLTKAVAKADEPESVYLLALLARHEAAASNLKTLAGRDDVVGALARFEMARGGGGDDLARMAAAVIEKGHPVVIGYVLERASGDVREQPRKAQAYSEPLLAYLEAMRDQQGLRQQEGLMVEKAAAIVADIGGEASLARLRKMLEGRYSDFQRAVMAGLTRTTNEAACAVAKDFVDSPYDELSTFAALTMGKFGKAEAAPKLRSVVANDARYRPTVQALAAWYLLKIDGAVASSVPRLAELMK